MLLRLVSLLVSAVCFGATTPTNHLVTAAAAGLHLHRPLRRSCCVDPCRRRDVHAMLSTVAAAASAAAITASEEEQQRLEQGARRDGESQVAS